MNSACAVVVVALVASTWGKPQPQRGIGGGRGGRHLFDDVPSPAFNGGSPDPNDYDYVGGFDDNLDFNQGFSREPDFEARQSFNGNQQGRFRQEFPNQPDQGDFSDRQQGFDRNPGFSQSDFDINQQDTFDDTGFGTEQDYDYQSGDFINEQDAIIPGPSGFGNQQVPFGQGEQNFGNPQENFVPTSQASRIQQTNRGPQTKRVLQTNRVSQSNRAPQASRIPQSNRNQLRNPQQNINQQDIFAQDRGNIGLEQERFGSQQNTQRELPQRNQNQQRNIRTGQGFGNQQERTGRGQQRFGPISGNSGAGQQRLRNQQATTHQTQQEFNNQQDFIDDVHFDGFQQNNIRPQQAALNRGQEGATLINGGLQNQNIRPSDVNTFQQVPEEELQTFPEEQNFLGTQTGTDSQQGFSGNQQSFSPSRTSPGTSQQGFGSKQESSRGQGRPGRGEQSGRGRIRNRQENFSGPQGFNEGSANRQQQQNFESIQQNNGNERGNHNRRPSNFNNQPDSLGTSQQNFNDKGRFGSDQQGIPNRQQNFNRQQPNLPQGQPGFNNGFRPQEDFEQEPIRPTANKPRNNAARQETNRVANNNRFPISQPGNGQQSFDNRQQGFSGSQQGFSGQRGFGGSQQGTAGGQQGFGSQQNFFN